jgi:alpha-soluble NSF attachment protein
MYESDYQYPLAVKHYQKSADLYYAESDYSSNYNKAKLKIADLSCHDLSSTPTIISAIKVYTEISNAYLQNRLLAPSARDLLVKATLLLLSLDDQVGCQVSLQDYQDKDPASSNSREIKFIQAILNSV